MAHFEETARIVCRWCDAPMERMTDPRTEDRWLVCSRYPACRYQEADHD